MKHNLVFLLSTFVFALQLKAQSSNFQFTIGYGQALSATELLLCHHNSLLIVGSDSSSAGGRLVLINTDTSGNVVWQKIVLNSITPRFESIKTIQTTDNGFCFTGSFFFPNGDSTIAVIKTDSVGHGLWAIEFRPDNGAFHDAGTAIDESPDGHLYIGGYYHPSVISSLAYPWLAKLDANGQLIWFKKLNVAGGRTLAVIAVSDTSIIAGINESGSMRRPVLAFTDSSGVLLKANRISPGYGMDLELADLHADSTLQYLSVNVYDSIGNVSPAQCRSVSTFNQQSFVSLVTSPFHQLRIKKCLFPNLTAFTLFQCSDSSAVTMIGNADAPDPVMLNWLIDTLHHSLPVSMQCFSDSNGFMNSFVLGNIPHSPTQSGIILTRAADPQTFIPPCNGSLVSTIQSMNAWPDSLYFFALSNITGTLTHPILSNLSTFYQVDQLCGPMGLSGQALVIPFILFPNPSNGQFTVRGNFPAHAQFEIFDTSGRKIKDIEIPEDQDDFTVNTDLSAGIYAYRILNGERVLSTGNLVIYD